MVVKLGETDRARRASARASRASGLRADPPRESSLRVHRAVRRPWGGADPRGAVQLSAINRKNRYTMQRGVSVLADARTADHASIDSGDRRAAFCGIDVLRFRRSPALHSSHVDDG